MGRAAVVLLLVARTAAAAPPLSLQLGLGGGAQWAERSGWVRDDDLVGMRAGIGLGPFAALDIGLSADLDRVETAFGVGVRVRPWAGPCWSARWSPYLRGQVSLVGASHVGSNYDLLAGAGHWGHFGEHVRWLAWFAELDVVARVGEYDAVSARIEAGLAVATPTFWP
jgi:hypothetical protein